MKNFKKFVKVFAKMGLKILQKLLEIIVIVGKYLIATGKVLLGDLLAFAKKHQVIAGIAVLAICLVLIKPWDVTSAAPRHCECNHCGADAIMTYENVPGHAGTLVTITCDSCSYQHENFLY